MAKRQKIRVGDIVHVRGVVKESVDGDGDVFLHFEDSKLNIEAFVPESAIVKIERRPWQVGDQTNAGVIVAIDCGEAWVKNYDGSHLTYSLLSLERVE